MGRTNPTFRDRLERLREAWDAYRRALRRRDRPHFDRLFAHARAHADACGYLNHDSPVVAVLLSVALEQEATIADLEERVAALEAERDGDAGDERNPDDCQAVIERYWSGDAGAGTGTE